MVEEFEAQKVELYIELENDVEVEHGVGNIQMLADLDRQVCVMIWLLGSL